MQYGKYVLFQLGNTYLPFVTCDNYGDKPQKISR